MLSFGLVSYFSETDEEQRYVAQICSQDDLGRPLRQQLKAQTVDDFKQALATQQKAIDLARLMKNKRLENFLLSKITQYKDKKPVRINMAR